jgi:hypothetical protein
MSKLAIRNPIILDAFRPAQIALTNLRDITPTLQPWMAPGRLSSLDKIQFAELMGAATAVSNASVASIAATSEVWRVAIDEMRQKAAAVTRESQRATNLDQDVAKVLNDGIDSLESLQREFGANALRRVQESSLLSPQQLIEVGKLIQSVSTDSIPWYGTISQVVKMLGVGDVEKLWDTLAEPHRLPLSFSAIQRAALQLGIAKDYFSLMLAAISEDSTA